MNSCRCLHLAQGKQLLWRLCDGAGQLIASSGAILTKSWLNKSLIKAGNPRSSKQASTRGIYRGDGSKHVAKILIDDKLSMVREGGDLRPGFWRQRRPGEGRAQGGFVPLL